MSTATLNVWISNLGQPCSIANDEGAGIPYHWSVAVAHCDDDTFHAVYDECSHAQIALSEGELDDCTLECWLHGSRFDLAGRPGEKLHEGRQRHEGQAVVLALAGKLHQDRRDLAIVEVFTLFGVIGDPLWVVSQFEN